MTKDTKISIALYHVANVSKFLGIPTPELEKMYASAKKQEIEEKDKNKREHIESIQIDLLTAIAVRRQYGLF